MNDLLCKELVNRFISAVLIKHIICKPSMSTNNSSTALYIYASITTIKVEFVGITTKVFGVNVGFEADSVLFSSNNYPFNHLHKLLIKKEQC